MHLYFDWFTYEYFVIRINYLESKSGGQVYLNTFFGVKCKGEL